MEPATARVPLTNIRAEIVGYALVDAADAPALLRYRWHHSRQRHITYASRTVRFGPGPATTQVLMHRQICGLPESTPHGNRKGAPQVDHADGDGLNNRRSNLRVTTAAGNAQNRRGGRGSSPYRGVSWNKKAGKWLAGAKLNGVRHNLGFYVDELEAARVASQWRAIHMPMSQDAQRSS